MTDLKPCPLCGSTNIRVALYPQFLGDFGTHEVCCSRCEVRIFRETKETGERDWNERPGELLLHEKIDGLNSLLAKQLHEMYKLKELANG